MADRSWISLLVIGGIAVALFYFLSKGGQGVSVSPSQSGPSVDPNVHPYGSAAVSGSPGGLAITEVFSPSYTSTITNETQNTITTTTTITPKIGLLNF